MAVIELEAARVELRQTVVGYDEPFPYALGISLKRVTEGDRDYGFYSDEACTKPLQVDTLVTVNGRLPSGVSKGISPWGGDLACI
jgi:hypothetical protein